MTEAYYPDAPPQWTPKERSELVLKILRGDVTIDQASTMAGVSAEEISQWKEQALQGFEKKLLPQQKLEKKIGRLWLRSIT